MKLSQPVNQCDGCLAGMPLKGGRHYRDDHSPEMVCQADKYLSQPPIFLVGVEEPIENIKARFEARLKALKESQLVICECGAIEMCGACRDAPEHKKPFGVQPDTDCEHCLREGFRTCAGVTAVCTGSQPK